MTKASSSQFKNALPLLQAALGMPRGKKFKNALLEWMRWPEFPAKQDQGWPVEDCRRWIQNNAQKIAQYWTGIELASGRVRGAAAAVSLLQKGGRSTPAPEPRTNTDGKPDVNPDLLRVADTQVSLAQKLQAYYGNRIRIVISGMRIQNWRRGRFMPAAGIPPPPACEGKYWNPVAWIEWFDKYCLRYYLRQEDGAAPDANGDLHTFKETVERAELEHRLKEIEIEKGKWVALEVHKQTLRRLGVELNAAINLYAEKELARTLREAIDKVQPPEDVRGPLIVAVEEGARRAADGLREKLKGHKA